MSQLNVDLQEIAKFEALAAKWWDQHSEFRPFTRSIHYVLTGLMNVQAVSLVKKYLMSAVVAVSWPKAWHVVAQMY